MHPMVATLMLLGATALLAGPAQAVEPSSQRSLASEQQQQRQRFTGVWALVDNANNLFNVRLSTDGSAVSTSGVDGVPLGGSSVPCIWAWGRGRAISTGLSTGICGSSGAILAPGQDWPGRANHAPPGCSDALMQ